MSGAVTTWRGATTSPATAFTTRQAVIRCRCSVMARANHAGVSSTMKIDPPSGAAAIRAPATAGTAEFDGLKMQREDDVLNLQLRMRSRDGTVRWQPFRFERYDPSAEG